MTQRDPEKGPGECLRDGLNALRGIYFLLTDAGGISPDDKAAVDCEYLSAMIWLVIERLEDAAL